MVQGQTSTSPRRSITKAIWATRPQDLTCSARFYDQQKSNAALEARNHPKLNLTPEQYARLEALQFYKVIGEVGADVATTFIGPSPRQAGRLIEPAIPAVKKAASTIRLIVKIYGNIFANPNDAKAMEKAFQYVETHTKPPIVQSVNPPRPPISAGPP